MTINKCITSNYNLIAFKFFNYFTQLLHKKKYPEAETFKTQRKSCTFRVTAGDSNRHPLVCTPMSVSVWANSQVVTPTFISAYSKLFKACSSLPDNSRERGTQSF